MSYFFIRGGESYRQISYGSNGEGLTKAAADHESICKNYENIAYTGNKELDTLDLICNNSYITYVTQYFFKGSDSFICHLSQK